MIEALCSPAQIKIVLGLAGIVARIGVEDSAAIVESSGTFARIERAATTRVSVLVERTSFRIDHVSTSSVRPARASQPPGEHGELRRRGADPRAG